MDNILWLVRVALIAIGSALTQRGVGDAQMWAEVVGAVLAVVGAVWSYLARTQLKAAAR